MKKKRKQIVVIILVGIILFSVSAKPVHVHASDFCDLEKILLRVETKSPIAKIEKQENRLQKILDNINEKDGFTEEELAKISEVAAIETNTLVEDNMEITEYVLEPKEELAIINREDGSKEYVNRKIVYSMVKDVGTTSSTATINKVYFKTELTYFHFNAGKKGHNYVKLIQTDCRINSGYANLSTLQAVYNASGTQYNEDAKEVKVGGSESGAARIHNVNGNGLYSYQTTTKYYYNLVASNSVIKVTMKLKFKTGTVKTYNIKI